MERTLLRARFICLCTLLVLSLTFSLNTINVGANPYLTKLYVDPSKVEYTPPAFGETFKVNVTIANVSNLKSLDLKLYWNTTLLDLVEAEIHPFLPPLWLPPVITEINETMGRYWLSIKSTGSANGSGPLVTLTFKITYEPVWPENATCTLNLDDTKLYDSNWNPILHDVYDGEYSYYPNELLSITTMTDKTWYWLKDTIHVHGNLTLGYSLVPDGLIALELDNPQNQPIRVRTLSTGVPPANQTVEVIDAIPCGYNGTHYNPRSWFYRGYTAYFNLSVKNNHIEPRRVLVVGNIYDAGLESLGLIGTETTIPGDSAVWAILPFTIPDTASPGDARIYVSALDGWPRNGGTAYCLEENTTFEIRATGVAGSTTSSPETLDSSPEGTYDYVFKLSFESKPGNYVVHTNSNYTANGITQKATNSVTFEVKVPDLNDDGKVTITDIVICALAFGTEPGDPNWDPIADVNGDGKVSITDIVIIALHFGWKDP